MHASVVQHEAPETSADLEENRTREKMESASRREGQSTPAPWRIPTEACKNISTAVETGIHAYIICSSESFDGTTAEATPASAAAWESCPIT